MELEEILKIRFPDTDKTPDENISQAQINRQISMADFFRKMVQNGLDINILIDDVAFREVFLIVQANEEIRMQRQLDELKSTGKSESISWDQRPIEQIQSNNYKAKNYRNSEKDGHPIETIQSKTILSRYAVDERGGFIDTEEYRELEGDLTETDPSKYNEVIKNINKVVYTIDGSVYIDNKSHEETYSSREGKRSISDSQTTQVKNDFDVTMRIASSGHKQAIDLSGTIVEDQILDSGYIARNEDGLTATYHAPSGEERQILLSDYLDTMPMPYIELLSSREFTEDEVDTIEQDLKAQLKRAGITDLKNFKSTNRFGITSESPALKIIKTNLKAKELRKNAKKEQEAKDNSISNIAQPTQTQPVDTEYIANDVPAINGVNTQNMYQQSEGQTVQMVESTADTGLNPQANSYEDERMKKIEEISKQINVLSALETEYQTIKAYSDNLTMQEIPVEAPSLGE